MRFLDLLRRSAKQEAKDHPCGEACGKEDGWFSTHPALDDRIKALRQIR